jgi:hypothetical protein
MLTITIAGTPDWAAALRKRLAAAYHLTQVAERAPGYVARLADDHTALLLTDGDSDEWRFWSTTPRSSPATRRIPVILVTRDPVRRAQALTVGADLALTPDELLAQIEALITDYARQIDPALVEQLECECREPLPPLAVEGIAKFNAGEYYRQHDLFEEQWVNTTTPVRDLYRAILQVGVAYYQIERGNHRGALKMLLRSVQWLTVLPDVCQGVDVRQLREDSYRVRAELERLKPDEIDQFDRALLKPVIVTHGP